ncbi:MAG: type VI secretion system-associated FHA domain protein TagH [Acetobacteraceae bacterium]
MALTLSVLRCPDLVAPETREVGGGEFNIGRGSDNDWVLADPERHLSKRHCMVAFRSGTWQLADVSTNGTFLNRESEPVGTEQPRTLRDGDRLRLGPYEIEIRIAEEAEAFRSPNPPARQAAADPFGDDPFAAVLGPAGAAPFQGASSAGDERPAFALPPDFDPLAPDPADQPFAGPAMADHQAAIEDAFRPPKPTSEMLPDDWDAEESLLRRPAAPPPPAALPSATPGPVPEVQAEPPVLATEPAAPTPAAPGDSGLLAAFLAGARAPDIRPADPTATMEALGAAFRALVTGLRQALIARAAIKGEFRIEQTIIRARGNNPLKFSAGDDDALAALIGAGRKTEMGPAEAVADALRDVRQHELAATAAMQSAVRALVRRFDPAQLAGAGSAGGLIGLAHNRKARAWDAFEKLHAEVTLGLADDFDSVFGKAFARAYEQALAEIAAREKEPS